jgi:hypothetical protein
MQAEGFVTELNLLDGQPAARITCPRGSIPAPGQYVLAHQDASDSPLADALFPARSFDDGFLAVPPAPDLWRPGIRVHLRGPLGHGFSLPATARRVALIAYDTAPWRILPLLDFAFKQDASVTLVCANPPDDLPFQVEVQPLSALAEVCRWADYVAADAARESLPGFIENMPDGGQGAARSDVLVRVPMPCGGLAQCGACAVKMRRETLLACEDGPVFPLNLLIVEI